MGCNRLAVAEDREAADLARARHIPYNKALRIVVAERYAKTLAALAEDKERMKRINDVAERAAEAALWAKSVVAYGGHVYSDMHPKDYRHKGDYGEGATALQMFQHGFEPVAFGGLNDRGIDSIWVRNGQYCVVESKSFGSDLKGDQMTHGWIDRNLNKALGGDTMLADHIRACGYTRLVSYSNETGVYEDWDLPHGY